MVYEVEFESGSAEYEYGIDARSGDIIWVENEDGYSFRQGWPNFISTEDEAKAAALSHAGLTADKVSKLHTELDCEGGRYVCEVEFKYDGYEYHYEVDAENGAVIKFDKELQH